MSKKLIELKQISKSFPGVKALEDINFDLYPGEIHCIVGGNGAGKSTLIKILSGVYTPDTGEIIVDEKDTYSGLTPHISRSMGIQTIYQEPVLAQTLSVAENIFLGDSLIVKSGVVDWRNMRKKAREILDVLAVDISVDDKVANLGIAGKQAVQIAKVLANNARVVIFDEPTASFGRKEVENLFRIIQKLKSQGVGIIYISHRLEEVFEIADRISVFKDGRCVNRHDGRSVQKDVLINEMVGRTTQLFYTRERVPIGDVILSVKHLSGDGVKDVSFELHQGEVLGIGGMVGSKRTELMRLLFGAGNITGGHIMYKGAEIRPRSPAQMIKHGICMITEDRAITGLMLGRDVKENIVISRNQKYPRFLLNLKEEKNTAEEQVKRLSIKVHSVAQIVRNLSGGNQQKVILAKWLLTQGDVFIMDEPTRGIDIGAKEEIYKLMVEIARQGGALLLVSSDMLEIVSMSDRIVVMRDGISAGELELKDISEENIMRIAVGG